jgi:poly-gamma-glutamate capsule biosynthesis protein CapA/YwtB (metallophosphatase superfamily)
LAKATAKRARFNDDIVKANSKQADAGSEGNAAAADYATLTSNIPAAANSAEASAFSKKLSDAAKRWSNADNKNKGGGKDLDKATRNKASAEAEISAAQSEIDQGRAMMAKAMGV